MRGLGHFLTGASNYLRHEEVFPEEQFQHSSELAVGICTRGMTFVEGVGVLAHEYLGLLLEEFRESEREVINRLIRKVLRT